MKEGEEFEPIKEIAKVYGPARQILLGERPALNMIARASGIAARLVDYFFPSPHLILKLLNNPINK